MGLCPSRNTKTSKAFDKVADNTNKDAVSASAALPTNAWRELLKDVPTTKDADNSKLQGAQSRKTKEDSEQSRRTKEILLRSIASTHDQAGVSSNRPQVSRPAQAGVQRDSAGPPKETATSTGTAAFVDTSAYMQLLKDGDSKKKTSKLSSNIRSQGKADVSAKRDIFSSAIPTSRWASALKTEPPPGLTKELGSPPGLTQDDVSTPPCKTVQDDIDTEKLSVDLDLSDPAYWSETECTGKEQTASDAALSRLRLARKSRNASAHRFGRRPRCAEIRSYVMQELTYDIDEITAMMLLRLQRFNEQQQIFKPEATGQRRFCIGLKEVGRRVKQSKVSCLVVAPNLEGDASDGGLDDRVREILAAAYAQNVPVIFALSRNRIGQAMGKHVPISVLGVLDATGTEELLKTAVKLSRGAREAWLKKKCSKN